ncbi:unnamed protein product [Rotaria sp. Silwood1]|nr:unnamed protein product [Rotaria sp. Silwood1]CAF4986707.1 unnamed protein product [Rotaria sp. Silwood1]
MLSKKGYQEIRLQLNNIPATLTNKKQNSLRKYLNKNIKKYECSMNFMPFEPLPHITYFINRTTTEACVRQLIQAATVSSEFTINTESINIYRKGKKPALMKLQIFLPHNSSFVVLIEMYHLPNENHICFKLTRELIDSINLQKQFRAFWQQQHPYRPSNLTSTTNCDCENCLDSIKKFPHNLLELSPIPSNGDGDDTLLSTKLPPPPMK